MVVPSLARIEDIPPMELFLRVPSSSGLPWSDTLLGKDKLLVNGVDCAGSGLWLGSGLFGIHG